MRKTFLQLLALILLSILLCCCTGSDTTVPVLVITDFGYDVDDAEAVTWLLHQKNCKLIGVVPSDPDNTDSVIMALHDFMNKCNVRIPILSSCRDIDSVFEAYQGELVLAVLAPPTAISDCFAPDISKAKKLKRIFIQGTAIVSKTQELLPDYSSYNLRKDTAAAETLFSLQQYVPFVLIGKYAAYQIALTVPEMDDFAITYGTMGQYVKDAAIYSLTSFAKNNEDTFRHVYDIPDSISIEEAIANPPTVSNPYDLLTAIAIFHPDCFVMDTTGTHLLCGNLQGMNYIVDKEMLINIILHNADEY
ncbi:MAG: hypothetical protein PHR20_00030 [Bacteroidales bacterium]|nr:hypothetical protein [Bacteroidales bacterium]